MIWRHVSGEIQSSEQVSARNFTHFPTTFQAIVQIFYELMDHLKEQKRNTSFNKNSK